MTNDKCQSFDYGDIEYGVIDAHKDNEVIADGFWSDYDAQKWIEDNKHKYPNSFLITTDFH